MLDLNSFSGLGLTTCYVRLVDWSPCVESQLPNAYALKASNPKWKSTYLRFLQFLGGVLR